MQMTFPPDLEGGALTVQLKAASHEEMEKLVRELGQALAKKAMREIFALLGGSD